MWTKLTLDTSNHFCLHIETSFNTIFSTHARAHRSTAMRRRLILRHTAPGQLAHGKQTRAQSAPPKAAPAPPKYGGRLGHRHSQQRGEKRRLLSLPDGAAKGVSETAAWPNGRGAGQWLAAEFTHIEVDIEVLGRDQSCERANYHSPCLPEAPGRARRSPLCARGEAKISVGAWTGVGGGAKKRRDAEIGHGFSPARGQGCAAVWSSAHQGGGSGRALNIRAGSGRPHLLLGPGFQHESPCHPGSATCSSAQVVGENVIATYQGRSARAQPGSQPESPLSSPLALLRVCCGSRLRPPAGSSCTVR